MKIFKISKKSLNIFYKITFISYVNCLKLSRQNIFIFTYLFKFSVKIHVFKVKNFDMLNSKILKRQIKNKILMRKKLRTTKNTKF